MVILTPGEPVVLVVAASGMVVVALAVVVVATGSGATATVAEGSAVLEDSVETCNTRHNHRSSRTCTFRPMPSC